MQVQRSVAAPAQHVVAGLIERQLHLGVRPDVERHLDVHIRPKTLAAHPARKELSPARNAPKAVVGSPLGRILKNDEVGCRDIGPAVAQRQEKAGILGRGRNDVHAHAVLVPADRRATGSVDAPVKQLVLPRGRVQYERAVGPHMHLVAQVARIGKTEAHVESGPAARRPVQLGRSQRHRVPADIDHGVRHRIGNVRVIDRRAERPDADRPVEGQLPAGIGKPQRSIGHALRFAQYAFEHRIEQRKIDPAQMHVGLQTLVGGRIESFDDRAVGRTVDQPEKRPARLQVPPALEAAVD